MAGFYQKYGDWALITGASSGIGEEFARQLAALRFNLVLVARRKNKLDDLSVELKRKYGISIVVVATDLSKENFLDDIVSLTQGIEVGLLINNAGFALTGNFLDHPVEDELSLLNVNCRAPLLLSHYFSKRMVGNGKGGIINVASVSALMPLPFWTNYSASKAYLHRLSQGLWYELKNKNIDVLSLCPGATKTGFAKVAGTNMAGMDVKPVVSAALNGLGKLPALIVGSGNRFIAFLLRLLPQKTIIKMGANAIRSSANKKQ